MEYTNLRLTVQDGVATVMLNRPDKLNALTSTAWEEINSALDLIEADDTAHSILL